MTLEDEERSVSTRRGGRRNRHVLRRDVEMNDKETQTDPTSPILDDEAFARALHNEYVSAVNEARRVATMALDSLVLTE